MSHSVLGSLDCLSLHLIWPAFYCVHFSRKTLIYLVLTLYHMYPDYDFRYLCILCCITIFSFQRELKRRIMGNATVSLLGDLTTHYIVLFYCIGSVVKRFWQTVSLLSLLEELRVQFSPFPKSNPAGYMGFVCFRFRSFSLNALYQDSCVFWYGSLILWYCMCLCGFQCS